jgi:tripartite-type tricarboxylate transporter receptor subunit TctC
MISLAKTDDQKKVIETVINDANEYSRPFALPPGTPKERVELLRKAFAETVKDKELLAEVEKMQMTLEPATGDELAAAVVRFAKADDAMKARLRDILFK